MTSSQIHKLHKSIATDFKIATRKTELWKMEYCHIVLHDIKKFMQFGYLRTASLMMKDAADNILKAKKYTIGYSEHERNDRPGNIDWEDGEATQLHVLLIYTESFLNLDNDAKIAFRRDNLKGQWFPSANKDDFPHLSQSFAKLYTHGGGGVSREDYN